MKKTLKHRKASRATLAFCAALLFPACDANASVVVTGTRIIFALEEQEATVRLTNKSKEPALVQAWVDSGDAAIDPNQAEAPFLVEPPISRIEPGKGQSIRLVHTGEPIPEDVESLFFFNVLDVPPKSSQTQTDRSSLQFALRTRIKLFLRPAGLRGTAAEAPAAVTWHIEQDGARLRLVARNPTPYHIVLDRIEAVSTHGSAVDDEGGQISPRGEQSFPIEGLTGSPESWKRVRFMTINDHGGNTNSEAEIDTRPITSG